MEQVFIKIDSGGRVTEERTSEPSLEFFQSHVGGWIEAIYFPNLNASGYVNEEGKLGKLPKNDLATLIWIDAHINCEEDYLFLAGDYIAGNVILMSADTDDEGSSLGLDAVQIQAIKNAIIAARFETVRTAIIAAQFETVRTAARCPECERAFDLTDETDAEEWAYGHDCEA